MTPTQAERNRAAPLSKVRAHMMVHGEPCPTDDHALQEGRERDEDGPWDDSGGQPE